MFERYVKRVVKGYNELRKRQLVTPDGEVKEKYVDGREIVDPVPIAPPVGWFKQPSMFDQLRDMVRSEHLRMYAASQGQESFEEAQDFEVEDDIFPSSQYENDFEPLENLQARRQQEFREQFLKERDDRYIKRKRREWADEDQQSPPKAERKSAEQPKGARQGAQPGGAGAEGGLDAESP